MYQQGYRPEPPQKRRNMTAGSQTGYAPPQQPPQPVPQPRQPRYRQPAQGAQENVHYVNSGYRPQSSAPNQKMQAAPKMPKAPNKNKKRFALAKLLVVLLVTAGLCGAGYYYYISNQVSPYDNTFLHGVYVDGIDLGGLTAQEGYDKVSQQAQNRQQSWNVKLMYAGQTVITITSDMLGMEIKVAEVLTQAWQLGRGGNIFEKKAAQDALKENPRAFFTVVPSANTAVIDDLLLDIKTDVYRAPQDASFEFAPNEAEPFIYFNETIGRQLDTQPLKERIFEMVAMMETGELEIAPSPIYPNVTVADLQAKTALRATVSTDIDRHSTENRTNNIRVSCGKINGTKLAAGAKFSFNTTAGVRSEKNGYFSAIEYAYGLQQEGIGGGVCQTSSTMYLAALKADLEILTRKPHSDSVSYVEYGQDATVNSEKGHEIDFVFRNDTDSVIYICASVETNPKDKNRFVCRVRIYGESLGEGVVYTVESRTIEVLKAPNEIRYDADTTQSYVTYRDETKFRSAKKDGCIVETYLNRIENGQAVETKLVSTDRYDAKQERHWQGTRRR